MQRPSDDDQFVASIELLVYFTYCALGRLTPRFSRRKSRRIVSREPIRAAVWRSAGSACYARKWLFQPPHCQRRLVLDQNVLADNRRMRPGRFLGHVIFLDHLRAFVSRARNYQIGVVGQREDRLARDDHRRVLALAWISCPERFARCGVEAEELAFVLVRHSEE